MKKKKILKKLKSISKKIDFKNGKIPLKNSTNELLFSDSDKKIKDKIRNLILRLIEKPAQIELSLTDDRITIENFKDIHKNSNGFQIEIIKEIGFIIHSDRRTMIKDKKLFCEVEKQIKLSIHIRNHDSFYQIYDMIMKDYHLLRNTNLDLLLNPQ